MSDIRRTHPGYFKVALGLSLTWYLGLGFGFVVFSRVASHSETNKLVSHYVPLLAWGIIYLLLGTTLLMGILVRWVPHRVVRGCCALGLVLTAFWLTCYIVSAFEGKLHLISVIPAWATIILVEWAALNEPAAWSPASAMIDTTALGTVIATGVASATGVAAYLNARRVRRVEVATAVASESADLQKIQIEGWKTLITTLRSEYRECIAETAALREQLVEARRAAEAAAAERHELRERVAVGDERISNLREAVTKLGGDVDKINGFGRKGPRGDKGPTGSKGATGDQGATGATGSTPA